MMFNRKKLLAPLIVVIVLVVVALIALTVWHKMTQKPVAMMKMMKMMAVPTVTVSSVKSAPYQPHIKVLGTLVAIRGVALKAPSSGLITAIHFQSNDEVKKGQLLLEVNPKALKAQLIAQQAQLHSLQAIYQRNKAQQGLTVSKSDLDISKANYQQQQAQVEATKKSLQDRLITAPFSGKLGLRQIHLGGYLNSGDTIVNIEQLNPLWVDFEIPTKYLASVKLGQAVIVDSEAYPKENFKGKVSAIAPLVTSDTGSFTVRATLQNPKKQLLPGQMVEVTLLISSKTSILSIPATAVIYSNKGSFVYRVVDKQATLTTVKLGEQIGQKLIVLSGLQAGDKIITAGTNKLHGTGGAITPAITTTSATQQVQE